MSRTSEQHWESARGAALHQPLDGRPLAPGPERASRRQRGKTGLTCVFTSRPAGCPHSAGEDTALGWPGSGCGPAQGTPGACASCIPLHARAYQGLAWQWLARRPEELKVASQRNERGLNSVLVLALLSLSGAWTPAPQLCPL